MDHLVRHRLLHLDERNFICVVCEQGFTTRDYLRDHSTTHSDTESYNCRHRRCRRNQNIILGDFNFVHNDLDRVNESRIGMNQVDKQLSTSWVDMMGSLDISDPFRVKNRKRRMFS